MTPGTLCQFCGYSSDWHTRIRTDNGNNFQPELHTYRYECPTSETKTFADSQASLTLTDKLLAALQGRGWVTRAVLAAELRVSVRELKLAANAANGAILAGNEGLKLTAEATQDELEGCCGRFRSQVSAMTTRIVQTRAVWELSQLNT